jgi:hypothetical protein
MELVTGRYVSYADLKNGNLNIMDLARISDALEVEAENRARIEDYYASERAKASEGNFK